MPTKRNMSPEEMDALVAGSDGTATDARAVRPFDFSRIDRIPKAQMRAVRRMHENFTRNLATTLAGHLRVYVSPTLVSLEQISYGEFVASLEPPTCLAYVGLLPFDGSMVFEVSRPLAFAAVELLLGSSAVTAEVPARKMTEIERQLMQNLLRPVLVDYRDTWRTVAEIEFEVQSLVDEPQDLRVLTAAEAVVAVSLEVTLGSTVGTSEPRHSVASDQAAPRSLRAASKRAPSRGAGRESSADRPSLHFSGARSRGSRRERKPDAGPAGES